MKLNQTALRILILCLFLLSAISVGAMLLHNCFNYYDFGIYTDALIRISWQNLNPYIPGLVRWIFCDHFDPIIAPISFFTRFVPAPYLGLFVEFLSMILCWIPLAFLLKRNRISQLQATLVYAIFLLSPVVSGAVHYPIHPTTWAAFPLLMFMAALEADALWLALTFFLLLCLYKEEFPYLGITTSVYLWFGKGKKKESLSFAIAGILILIFDFVLRPRLLGPVFPYSQKFLSSFFSDPIGCLVVFINYEGLRFWVRMLIPLILILPLSNLKKNWRGLVWIFWIVSPLFATRFISGLWYIHYGPVAAIGIIAMYLQVAKNQLANTFRIYAAVAAVLVMYGQAEYQEMVQAFSSAPPPASQICSAAPERLQRLEAIQKEVAGRPEQNLLLGRNLAVMQFVYSPHKNIYSLDSLQDYHDTEYQLVLSEKKLPEDHSEPEKYAKLLHLFETLRSSPDVKVLKDDQFLFLAVGRIRTDL